MSTSTATRHATSGEGLERVVAAVGRETTLARIGLGLMAVHVVDDSFLQPQPGLLSASLWISIVPAALVAYYLQRHIASLGMVDAIH